LWLVIPAKAGIHCQANSALLFERSPQGGVENRWKNFGLRIADLKSGLWLPRRLRLLAMGILLTNV